MSIKIITLLTLLLSVSTSFAEDPIQKEEIKEKRVLGFLRGGISQIETHNNGSVKKNMMVDLELDGRYALSDSFAANVSIGKWMGGTEITNESGGLAYHLGAGVVYSITGSLVDRTEVKTQIVKTKSIKDESVHFITKLEKITIKNKFDGLRIGLYASEFSFSKLNDSVFGVGGTLFYEQRLKDKGIYLQYGIKGDKMADKLVNGVLFQGFISVGF